MANISLRKLLESALNVEDAADDADKLGLTHKSFGRYYDDQGQYVAKSVDGNLVKVSGDQPAAPDRPPTKPHPSAYMPVHPNFKKAAADLDAQRSQDAGEFDRPYSYELPDDGPMPSMTSMVPDDDFADLEPAYGQPHGHIPGFDPATRGAAAFMAKKYGKNWQDDANIPKDMWTKVLKKAQDIVAHDELRQADDEYDRNPGLYGPDQ